MTKPVAISFQSHEKITQIGDGMGFDLVLVNQGKKYPVNSFIAAHFSRKIYYSILEDVSQTILLVNVKGGDFNEVKSYLMGSQIKITQTNSIFLFNAACELQIQSLIDKTTACILQNFNSSDEKDLIKILDLVVSAFSSNMNFFYLIPILSKNFNSISKYLDKVPDAVVDKILANNELNASERDLYNFLTKRVDFNKNPNNRLIKYIPPQYFTPRHSFYKILDNPNLNMNVLRSIVLKQRFVKEQVNTDEIDNIEEQQKEIPPGQNIPQNSTGVRHVGIEFDILGGIISLQMRHPVAVLSYPKAIRGYEISNLFTRDDSYFCCKIIPNDPNMVLSNITSNSKYLNILSKIPNQYPYLLFDFGEKNKIRIDGYVMRSFRLASNKVAPISWSIEGSNDGINWTMIDQQTNRNDLTFNSKSVYFPIRKETEYFSMYKLTQYDTGNEGNKALALSYFDIFGYI